MGIRFTITHLGSDAERPLINRPIGSSTLSIEERPCYSQPTQVGRDSVEPSAHEVGRNPPSHNAGKSASFSDLLPLG